MLLGAERTVARVWYEHQNKAYTPIQLHEILDAMGNTNVLAQQDSKSTSTAAGSGTSHEEPGWTPKGVLSVIDALNAIQWCWILCQIGHEIDVVAYLNFWRQLVRAKAQRIEQVKLFWNEAGWKMALEMRNGRPFDELAREIMGDKAKLSPATLLRLPSSNPSRRDIRLRESRCSPPGTRTPETPRNTQARRGGAMTHAKNPEMATPRRAMTAKPLARDSTGPLTGFLGGTRPIQEKKD